MLEGLLGRSKVCMTDHAKFFLIFVTTHSVGLIVATRRVASNLFKPVTGKSVRMTNGRALSYKSVINGVAAYNIDRYRRWTTSKSERLARHCARRQASENTCTTAQAEGSPGSPGSPSVPLGAYHRYLPSPTHDAQPPLL